MLNSSFQPIFFDQYLSNVKSFFADNWRAEQTTFSVEKHIFSKTIIWPFFMDNPALRLFGVLIIF